MADLNITAAVTVSTENAEAGFDRIGDKAERMAADVAGAAGKAGAAVDKIGDGAAKGAENFTRSESRIRDSIKRTTQDLNLLGKTASEKLEFKINDKGLDPSKFSSYIAELKKAEQAQLALSAASANAGAAASGSLNKIGISAAQTANALRGVPAQFTDIVVSLQGGQAPLTVFLQQGGQLKDMFGGAGNAARALGGYVVGLINPFAVAAAAAGALGLAYFKGSQEATEFSKALILSGNASGATAGQLQGFAQAISKVSGTQGAAAAALTEFAASGKVGADNLQRFTQAAVQFEKATGTAVSETVKQFAELGKSPVEASVKLNEQINYLTVSVYKQIKALEDQGRATEAAELAQTTFADTLAARTGQIVANVGYIEGAWKAVKNAISGAADAALNVGRAPSSQDRIDTKRSEIGRIETLIGSGNLPSAQALEYQTNQLALKKQELSLLTESERVIKRTVEGQAQQAAITKQYIDFTKQGAEFATKSEKREKELLKATTEGQALVNAGLLTQVDLNVRLAGIREKYKEAAGATGQVDPFIAVMKGINERVAAVKLEIEQGDKLTAGQKVAAKVLEDVRNGTLKLTESKAALLGKGLEELLQGEALRVIDVARLKATEDANKERQKSLDATIKDTASLQEQINKQLDQTASIGLSKEAIAALTAQRELDKASTLEGLAIKELDRNLDVQQFDATMAKVKAMRDLATAQKDNGARETAAEEAKKATAEWKKFSDSVYNGLTDSLYRAFESGKGFFKSFWDGIRNLFKTTVLKLAIQGVVSGVTGSLGFAGAANAADGTSAGGFNLSSLTNSMSSLSGAFTKFAGSSTGQSLGLSNSTAIAGNNPSAFVPAGGELTSMGSQLGSAMGVAGNTLAGYAMGSMARSLISGGYSAGNGMDNLQKAGIAIGSAIGGPVVGAIIGAGTGVFNRLFGRKLDDTGIEGSFGGMRGFEGNSFEKLKGGFLRSDKNNTSALAEDARAALGDAFGLIRVQVGTFATALGMDAERINSFTSTIKLSLKGLDPKAAEAKIQEALANAGNQLASSFDTGGFAKAGETSLATLGRLATSISAVNGAFGQLDVKLLAIGLAGADSASKLIEATGGLQAFTTQISSYYENFYSEAERTAKATQNLTSALGALGVDALPASREAFRKLVEQQDVTTDAGRKQYASLLQLSGAFAELTPASMIATAAVESIAEAYKRLSTALKTNEQIAQERINLQDQINALADTSTQALTRQRDALDASNRALFDQVQALEKAKLVASERAGLQDQINTLTDTSAQALTRQREALDASNQSLFDQIQAINAVRAAAKAAAAAAQAAFDSSKAAFDSSKAATNNALAGVRRAIEDEKTRIVVIRDAAAESVRTITGVFTLLRDQVEQLYGTVESAKLQQATQGNAFINQALTAAKNGGALPDQQELAKAIAAASGGLDANQFATQFEADQAALVLAGNLSELKDIAGPQLTAAEQAVKVAEKQLDALNAQLNAAQDQVDALRGIDNSVLSVADAIARLQAAIETEFRAQTDVLASVLASLRAGAIGSVSAIDQLRSGGANIASNTRSTVKTSSGPQDVYASSGGALGLYSATGIDIFSKDGSRFTGAEAVDFVTAKLATNDAVSVYARALETGISAAALDALMSFAPGTSNDWADANNLPKFAVGTNYVPRDMLAQIHEGEAIVPKAYNPAAGGAMGSSNTERLESLVEGLTLEVQRLQAVVATGNANTRRTADAVNGNPEVPMLVQTV